MKAKSIKGTSAAEIKTALDKTMSDGFKPTLAIAFVSVSQDRKAICQILDEAAISIFGVTTNGEFIDESAGKESAAILLLDMNRNYFNILFEEFPEKNYRETAADIATKALEQFTNPAFLIAGSHLETDAEQMLFGFEDIIGKQVNIFGGMAGDDFNFSEQFIFTNNKSSNRGMVVLAMDENKIDIKGRATCGWKPMGTARTVTRSAGNHVYTIDDTPVIDLARKFGGLDNLSPDHSFSEELSTHFPLQLQREVGEPVMRPAMVIDWADHSFYCSGSVPQGSKVRFSIPPDFDVVEKVIQSCENLKTTEISDPDALVIFSCGGRVVALGPLISQEIEGIQKVWENTPLVGMFSNAELGRATGGNLEMHNLTTCCVAIKEK